LNDSIKSQWIAFSLMPFDTAKGCAAEETPFRLLILSKVSSNDIPGSTSSVIPYARTCPWLSIVTSSAGYILKSLYFAWLFLNSSICRYPSIVLWFVTKRASIPLLWALSSWSVKLIPQSKGTRVDPLRKLENKLWECNSRRILSVVSSYLIIIHILPNIYQFCRNSPLEYDYSRYK